MKIRACIIVLIMVALTGCVSVTPLTSRESDLVAEYAAGVLLKYDKNYNNKLVKMIETEEIESEASLEEDISGETEGVIIVEEETTVNIQTSLNEILKTEKATIHYEGYFITDTYPEDDSMLFAMKAVNGYKLLVLEFTIENPTDEVVVEDILSKKSSFNLLVNEEIKANSQLTMLLDDLSSFKGEIEANSVKDLVLIFQIPDRYEKEDSISSMTLNIRDANTSVAISLK